MGAMRIPRIRLQPRGESDAATFMVACLAMLAGGTAGWSTGRVPDALMAIFATFITLGALYSVLAWFFGWPKLKWRVLGAVSGSDSYWHIP
jgi:hypothetical protein